MGSSLINTAIKDTYEGLIKTSDTSIVSSSAKYLSDGAGNDSVLAISTTAVGIGTTSPAKALDVSGSIRASDGIMFGTDTAPANTLDDYEEGTFTPAVAGGTTDGSATYSIANGAYTKIGRVVHFQIYLDWANGTGTGDLLVSGLPFAILDAGAGITMPSCSISEAKFAYSANTVIAAEGVPSSSSIVLMELPVGGGAARGSVAYVATGILILSGTYFTA